MVQDHIDVFFSYSWAAEAEDPDLRDWCRAIASIINSALKLKFNSGVNKYNYYLDRDKSLTGESIKEVIERSINSSRVFVAIVSDYYNTEYCLDEATMFRNLAGKVEWDLSQRLSIIHVQRDTDINPHWWPDPLKGADGKPLLCDRFFDERTGYPIGYPLTDPRELIKIPELRMALGRLTYEIGQKVANIRRTEAIKATHREQSQKRELNPTLFFEAELVDNDRWQNLVSELRSGQSNVVPVIGPKDMDKVTWKEWNRCDGVVMLHSRPDDEIQSRVVGAHWVRRELIANVARNAASHTHSQGGTAGVRLDCVVLDEQGELYLPELLNQFGFRHARSVDEVFQVMRQ
jgi:hypothetical protein